MKEYITIKVKLVGVLRSYVDSDVIVFKLNKDAKLMDLINEIKLKNPNLYSRIMRENGELYPDIYIAINDIDIRLLDHLNTKLNDEDTVLILAYIHGG